MKKANIINPFVIAFLTILCTQLFGQKLDKPGCGYEGVSEWFEHYIQNKEHYQFDRTEDIVWVPMTVHVLGDDNGNGYFPPRTLFAAICQLNEDFATADMQFYLEDDFNYIDNSSWYDHETFGDGIIMMRTNNVANTVNCYIVQNPAGTCGYYSGQGNAVAISKSCNSPNDHTWAHELGHFFSLPHTFVGWEGTDYEGTIPGGNRRGVENVSRSNCSTTADRFCDTPADYLSYRWTCNSQGKSGVVQTDPQGAKFQSDGTLFMSYANDACMTRFSGEQMDAMNANLRTRRSELLVNPSPLPPITENVSLISPTNGTELNINDAELVWSEVENATQYYVRVSRLPTVSGLFAFEGFVQDTSLMLTGLDPGRTYYWRVQPINNYSYCTNVSSRSSFKAVTMVSNEDHLGIDLQIAPNPVQQGTAVWVNGIQDGQSYTYQLTDLTGRTMMNGTLDDPKLPLPNLRNGIYLLTISDGEKSGTEKLIIK